MTEYAQTYRDRATAYREFIEPQGLPVRRAKFYEDCLRLSMVQTDKSLRLGDLLAYVQTELKVHPIHGQRLEDKSRARETEELELRKLRAEVEAKERANRKDDARWMERIEHEAQMAAFAGRLEEVLHQLTTLRLAELGFACGAPSERLAELYSGLTALYAAAFSEAVAEQVHSVVFAADDPADPRVEAADAA